MTDRRAVDVKALPGARLYIHYADGLEGELALGRAIAANPGLARLADPAFFATVAIVDGGAGIGWPDDIAIDARAQRARLTGGSTAAYLALTPELLDRAGTALYGRNWKSELSEALGIHDPSRLRAMMRGDRPIPPGFAREIADLLRERAAEMETVRGALEANNVKDGVRTSVDD